ncbi:hypothetical protein F5144DRAFT_539596 [Chaetomium tenue]|uniref:Uncharacterized protein n=1 Tax=Chaetomium tenue TaxID=1854479 RepID=A0ACB7NZA8_9PEZI|nr:hypothetical protein F5144DRAFT_539596 [Chaetomium globosum]
MNLDDTSTQSTPQHNDINQLSHPYPKSSKVLDLPDELLLGIFEHVENFDFNAQVVQRHEPGMVDIQNVRLVCRRFCNVSSQLLVRSVRIGLDESSLVRLDEISRSRGIAKGVRAVRVVLDFYNPSFTNFDLFISNQADQLQRGVEWLSDEMEMGSIKGISQQTASQMIDSRLAAKSTLRRLQVAPGDPDNSEYSVDDHLRRVHLEEIQKRYLLLLEKQTSLLNSGKFVNIVSSAIARMPCARALEFSERNPDGKSEELMTPEGDVWEILFRFILQPMTSHDADIYDLELPNYQCIVDLLDATRRAGTLLYTIGIKLWLLGSPGTLAPAPDRKQEFSSGMQQLKDFKFSYGGTLRDRDVEGVSKFLSACLDTSSLQRLDLDISGWVRRSATIELGRVLGLRPRKQLTDISLFNTNIDLPMLVRLFKQLPEKIRVLTLSEVRLFNGRWETLLDGFRKKRPDLVLIEDLEGAECDNMSRRDYKRIFNIYSCENNQAELYVSNMGPEEVNPFRTLGGD